MILFFRYCFTAISVFPIIAFPQINFHLTDSIINQQLEHNCLKTFISSLDEQELQEVLSFCLTDSMLEWNIQLNFAVQNFTFDQLRKQNITVQQLYQWSASIDLIEQYQLYIITNELSTLNNIFYNCTAPRFGPLCQYEFIYLPSQNYTLTQLISEFYRKEYEPKSLTCYVHLQCDRGIKSICLDWTEICDEYVHCINDQIDEKFCGKLQINECGQDEYRCRNGQCISKEFLSSPLNIYECLDGSDGINSAIRRMINNDYLPIVNREDILCTSVYENTRFNLVLMSSCDITRQPFLREARINNKPTILSNICYFAFMCTFYIEERIMSKCKDICTYKRCELFINETCPEVIIVPSTPIAFGHIFVGYVQQTDIDVQSHSPEFICYDEKLCRGFKPNVELFSINNKTCRQTQDSSIQFRQFGFLTSTITKLIDSIHKYLRHCNTISYEDVNICNSSFMYQCQNSSKCISIYNLCNKVADCDYDDDEMCSLINGSCSPIESNVLIKCPLNKRCISLSRFGDNICDCPHPDGQSCEDEIHSLCLANNIEQCTDLQNKDYIENYISFPTVCDGFQELLPIINGTEYTDESECQLWPCNNTYTRCDGLWNCLNGADEVDCEQKYPLINCPLHHHICVKPKTFELICLPLTKANNGDIDCLDAIDEPILCRSKNQKKTTENLYCQTNNSAHCSNLYSFLTADCIFENHDLFFNLSEINDLWNWPSNFDDDSLMNSSYLIKYYFSRRSNIDRLSLTQFSLQEKVSSKQSSQILTQEPHLIKEIFNYNFECHRGYPLRLWINQTLTRIICFCPSSYYGDYCQYQNQRVSLTLKFQPYSDSRRTLFSIVIQLIDNTTQRIVHSTKQLTYIYVKHCHTKFNFYLIYSTRPKKSNQTYFIHIDFYEKLTFGYRGSLHIPLHFPFLPVHRVSFVLNMPHDNSSLTTKCPTSQPCVYGQCMKYAENSNNATFCHCKQGWTGKDCSMSYNCSCSSDSLCVGIEANGRSICICPTNKWGPRCLLLNTICQSNTNSTCLNNGQCVLIDDNLISEQKFFCICPKGFSGDRCELEDSKIIVSFDTNIIRSETMRVHFIKVQENGPVRNGLRFQSVPLYQKEIIIRWSRPFHIVFAQISHDNYYLINVEKDYNRSGVIRKLITSFDRCGHMSEYVNDTILNYSLIRRIKYYHLPCQKQISCFYDRDHFCLCNDFGSQRVANCFRFDSSVEHNCSRLSNCKRDGQCVQDDIYCPQTSRCICPECFYGSLCQFSSSLFDVSLDGIIGPHIQPNLSFSQQPVIILITLILIVIMIISGFINGILCLLVFRNKETRQVGCGYYLLGSTITTLLTSIMLAFKFSILLYTQISIVSNRLFLKIHCHSFDYLLSVCLNLDKWLNACVAMERAFNIVRGARFDTKKSKIVAKRMIIFLLVMTTTLTIYDPIHRQLVDDDSNDEQKRTWCIVSYPPVLLIFNQIIHLFHFFVPFVLNIISALIILILSTQRRRKTCNDKTFIEILHEQIEKHRHLLISPFVLVILSLPRLIISFVAGCMSSDSSPWIYLIGYLGSFIPPMLTFVIFVLPSKLYKDEFRRTIIEYRKTLRKRFAFI